MSVLPPDYDADPERFLSNAKWPHDDVHPYVAARFQQAGARLVLDVGGGNGNLARLLPDLSMRCVLVDLSPSMLALAPRPAVRADGARLPVADARFDAVAALYTLSHYGDPLEPLREARRVLRAGGLLAACSSNRDSTPELALVLPAWGASTTFDGEDAPAIVASVFSAPGDQVQVQKWDAPMHTAARVLRAGPGRAAGLGCGGGWHASGRLGKSRASSSGDRLTSHLPYLGYQEAEQWQQQDEGAASGQDGRGAECGCERPGDRGSDRGQRVAAEGVVGRDARKPVWRYFLLQRDSPADGEHLHASAR